MFNKVIDEIYKKHGKQNDLIIYDPKRSVQAIPSGCFAIDMVTGYNGLAVRGRLVEIFGMESSGKTTVAIQSCAETLKLPGELGVLYVDSEQTFDHSYARSLGVDVETNSRFLVVQPNNAEEGIDIIDSTFKKLGDKLGLIVIDSIAAFKPKSMMEGNPLESGQKGVHAQLWSEFAPRLNSWAKVNNTAVLLINQLRAKISIDRNSQFSASNTGMGAGFSNTDTQLTTTGGNALRFYLSARYLLQHSSNIKESVVNTLTDEIEEQRVANLITIKNVKSKVSSPFSTAKFVIRYGEGTDDSEPIFNLCKAKGVIKNTGSWFEYKGSNESLNIRENGRVRFMDKFRHHEYLEDAKKQILSDGGLENLGIDKIDASVEGEEVDL